MTETSRTTDAIIDALKLAEQVSLVLGEDYWSLPAIERLDIDKLRTVLICASLAIENDRDIENVIEIADHALYEAKAIGRNRVVLQAV